MIILPQTKLDNYKLFKGWFIVCLLLLAVYHPFGLYFLNDDFIHVSLSEDAVFGQHHSIRVVNDFSLYLDSLLYKNNPVGYHFTNLLLHFTNIFLLIPVSSIFFRLLGLPQHKWAGHAAAIFFALYPFHSESVFWVIGRGSSLATMWLFISVLALHQRKLLLNIAGTVFYFLALLTYESVVIFPLLLLMLYLMQRKKDEKTAAHWLLQTALATAALVSYILIRWTALGSITDYYESGLLMNGNAAVLAKNYGSLFVRLFIGPSANRIIFASLCIAIFSMAAYIFYQNFKTIQQLATPLFCLVLMIAISLLPYISLGIDTHGVESERYLYLPSVFLSLLAVQVFYLLSSKMKVVLTPVYLVYVCYFLFQSSSAFRTASSFARLLVQTTASYVQPAHQQIVYYGMPGEHNGAVLFRTGLPEAIRWLIPAAAQKNIQVAGIDNNPLLSIGKAIPVRILPAPELLALLPTALQMKCSHALIVIFHNNELLIGQQM